MRYVHVLSKGDPQDIQRAAVDLAYTSMLAGHVVAVAADKHSIGWDLATRRGIRRQPVAIDARFNMFAPMRLRKPNTDTGKVTYLAYSQQALDVAILAKKLHQGRDVAVEYMSTCKGQNILPGTDAVHNFIPIFRPIGNAHKDSTCDQPTLLYFGGITPECGLETLLEAMPLIKGLPLRLKVAGTGEGRTAMPIVRHSRRMDIPGGVEWLGDVDDMAETIRSATIAAVPGSTIADAGKILTAFSCGTPVVFNKEALENAGIECPIAGIHATKEEIAEAVTRLYNDTEERRTLAIAGKVFFESLSNQKSIFQI